MTIALKVHPSFFKEFATKTWVSPADVIKELIENAFDEDATRVLITILNDHSISIEDNAGMDESEIQKFLLLGSPHKKVDSISPKLKRVRTCLLYTSDAADERSSVDLGGRRIIKKKKKKGMHY